MTSAVRRVAVLTADVGEGHVAAARVVADELRAVAPGIEVSTLDALELLGPALRLVLRDAYRMQLRRLPWAFGFLFALFLHVRLFRRLGRVVLAACGARRMRSALDELRPDLVVSTYPAATSVLGTLRRRGVLDVPACATITDLAGVEFWAHDGIDLHLVTHDALVALVEREAGSGSALVVAPIVAPAFRAAPKKSAARRALGLPQRDRIVVVSGGGWGVGDLEGAVAEAAALPDTTVICLSGRNARLHAHLIERFTGHANVRIVAFTDAMAAVLAAADVLVHTTGGVTCLEAMSVGCPIVAYGPPPGHAPTLARAMARLGIAAHATSRLALRAALVDPPVTASPVAGQSVAHALLGAECRSRAGRPLRRKLVAGAAVTAALFALFLAVGSRSAFAVIAYSFDLAPTSVLPTHGPDVGLVVETPPGGALLVARRLASHGESASFLLGVAPTPRLREALRIRHDDVIGILGGSGVDDWVGALESVSGGMERLALAPPGGLSTGQYLLARLADTRLVEPESRLRPGAILVCTPASLPRLLGRLGEKALHAEAVGALAA